jgi:hypothetical protein
MTLLAVILVVPLLWLVLASVRDGRGQSTAIDPDDTWMVEQHERVVRLGQETALPAGHPLARLALGERRS